MEVHAHTHTAQKNGLIILGSFLCYSLLCSVVSSLNISWNIRSKRTEQKNWRTAFMKS